MAAIPKPKQLPNCLLPATSHYALSLTTYYHHYSHFRPLSSSVFLPISLSPATISAAEAAVAPRREEDVIKQIINKNKLVHIEFTKTNLNKFLNYLNKKSKYKKIKKREIKPKYIVQIKTGAPLFKVFINSKKKAPLIFQRFFDNAFRDFFKIKGVPISYQFISSSNPYSD